jgi:hypothetical protein
MQQIHSSDIIGLFLPIRIYNIGHKVIIGYDDWGGYKYYRKRLISSADWHLNIGAY